MTRTHKRRAFTLVELLVVIGIIALLIGILLPTLSRAREASRVVSCLSNVRQLNTIVQLYANDFGGAIPYAWGPDNELVNRRLRLYMSDDAANGGTTRVYHCPSLRVPLADDFSSTYAVNTGTFIFSPDFVDPRRPPMKLSRIPRSTEIISFGDANQIKVFPPGHPDAGAPSGGTQEFFDFYDWWFPAPDGDVIYQPLAPSEQIPDAPLPTTNNVDEIGRPSALRYRHHAGDGGPDSGTVVVGFHDGHAEGRKVGELTQRNVAVTY